ncbi:unnamed protein product, partial [Symbiodinium sp. CCMP2456]
FVEMYGVPQVEQGQFSLLSTLRSTLGTGDGELCKGKGQAGGQGQAKSQGKGLGKPAAAIKGALPEAVKPTVESLPVLPKAGAVPNPKAPQGPQALPSTEKQQLDALVKCLGNIKEALPAEAVEAIEQLQLHNTHDTTKEMHRAVAAQSAAKKQLIQVKAARAAYIAAWNEYIIQVSDLIKTQVQDQATQLEHYDNAEAAWASSLEKATADLSRMATGSAIPIQDDGETDMDVAEALVDHDIETTKELEDRRNQQLAESAKLVEAMAALKESAAQRLEQESSEVREGSRTPRRQKQPAVDLTKEGDKGDKEEQPDGAQPKQPRQQQQPPSLPRPPGGASA